MNPQSWTRTTLAMVLGAVAITLVTLLLIAAVYSVSAANQVDSLVHNQLADANRQLDVLRANADATQVRSDVAARQRADLLNQNMTLQRQVNALVRYLRSHGIRVPVNTVTAPRPSQQPSNRPKVPHGHWPHHHGPGGPGPPPVTPSTGTITELCAMVPGLCSMLPPPLGKALTP